MIKLIIGRFAKENEFFISGDLPRDRIISICKNMCKYLKTKEEITICTFSPIVIDQFDILLPLIHKDGDDVTIDHEIWMQSNLARSYIDGKL